MLRDRRPLAAGILSLMLPGLGLFYLGYRRAAILNFLLVNAAILMMLWMDPHVVEHVHYLFLGLAALSAGYAHGVATSSMRAAKTTPLQMTQDANTNAST